SNIFGRGFDSRRLHQYSLFALTDFPPYGKMTPLLVGNVASSYFPCKSSSRAVLLMAGNKRNGMKIVITGVTPPILPPITEACIRLGHTVIGCARTANQIEELAHLYPIHDFRAVDVSHDADVKTWANGVLNKFGPPDFVLNNAAVLHSKASLWEVDDQEFS